MTGKFTANNIENDELTLKNLDNDYKNLIIRLQEISATIDILEKQYLDKQ